MKRLAALGAVATLSLLAGCATSDGYYSGAYGYNTYGYGYPDYAYGYGPGYVPYYDDFGYPYAYGPAFAFGFSDFDSGGHRHFDRRFEGRHFEDGRRFTGRTGEFAGRTGEFAGRPSGFSGRPSGVPANVGPQGVAPQAVGPQGGGGGGRHRG